MTKNQPFFTHDRVNDTFMPTPVATGPWDPNSLHGRVVVGLLAHVIEQCHGSEEFVPARLTVDMFRLPNTTTPIEVTTKLVRDGMRIKVVEAEFISGGTSMARASCQLLRRTENAPGGLGYINSDVTLYLHRLPVTRWIGFDVVNHHASDGIAIGECWLYDEKGPIGTSTVAALAQRKPMTNVPPP